MIIMIIIIIIIIIIVIDHYVGRAVGERGGIHALSAHLSREDDAGAFFYFIKHKYQYFLKKIGFLFSLLASVDSVGFRHRGGSRRRWITLDRIGRLSRWITLAVCGGPPPRRKGGAGAVGVWVRAAWPPSRAAG